MLFLVVFDMAMKPSFADHNLLAYGIGGFALATVAIVTRGARGLARIAVPAPEPA